MQINGEWWVKESTLPQPEPETPQGELYHTRSLLWEVDGYTLEARRLIPIENVDGHKDETDSFINLSVKNSNGEEIYEGNSQWFFYDKAMSPNSSQGSDSDYWDLGEAPTEILPLLKQFTQMCVQEEIIKG